MSVLYLITLGLALCLVGGGLWWTWIKTLKPARIQRLARQAAETHLSIKVIGFLGIGREGVVLEVSAPNLTPEPCALKILYAHTGKACERVLARLQPLALALKDAEHELPCCWPRVLGSGTIALPNYGPVPYQILSKIPGRPLSRAGLGRFSAETRLRQLAGFIQNLESLSARGLHFIHVDPDNVMLDDQGAFYIIDLDGFHMGQLDPDRWYRMSRRLARTILATIDTSSQDRALFSNSPEFQAYLRRLRLLRDSTKRRRPAPEIQFQSLSEFRAPIESLLNSTALPKISH